MEFLFNLMNIVNEYYFFPIEINELMRLLLLIIYSLFDGRVDVVLVANKNKTSYDALSVVLFISSASTSNMFLLADLVFSDRLSLLIIESSVNVNISFISL